MLQHIGMLLARTWYGKCTLYVTCCESSIRAIKAPKPVSGPVSTNVYNCCASPKNNSVLYVAKLLEDLGVYERKIAV